MARSTNVSSITPDQGDAAEKRARRTPAQIQQDLLDLTNEKLEKARARKTRLQGDLERATASISELESLSEYQASHPALQKAASEVPADLAVAEDVPAE